MRGRCGKSEGFTLLEIMIALAMVSILTVLGVSTLRGLLLKQQASGSRRASMILAFGSTRWINPRCRKLFGILSMKKGLPRR